MARLTRSDATRRPTTCNWRRQQRWPRQDIIVGVSEYGMATAGASCRETHSALAAVERYVVQDSWDEVEDEELLE